MDGVYRGKRVSAEQFLAAARGDGFPQCDVVFGWDIAGRGHRLAAVLQLGDRLRDIIMRPDLGTFAVTPLGGTLRERRLRLLHRARRSAPPVAPRTSSSASSNGPQTAGYISKMAAELEVRFFREDQESLREKDYTNLRPLNPGLNCYSIHHASIDEPVIGRVCQHARRLRHRGRGVQPRARRRDVRDQHPLHGCPARRRPDDALQERHEGDRRRRWAPRRPSWPSTRDDLDGCGGHLHQSLWSSGSETQRVLGRGRRRTTCRDAMRHYLAGVLDYATGVHAACTRRT